MCRQETFLKEIFAFKYSNKIPYKTFFIMFDLILSETFLVEKTTFALAMLTLLFRMGHENFTHRFHFQKQQSTTVTFIFSLIKILLLKFST